MSRNSAYACSRLAATRLGLTVAQYSMTNYRWLQVCLLLIFAGSVAIADDSASNTNELQWLRKKVEELEQKVRALEDANRATAQTNKLVTTTQAISNAPVAESAKNKPMPELSIGAEGFSLTSADRDFALQLKGVLQVD